ncbi:MAG: FAD-binding oxidoreductase [Dehalococcoidia bacterium]
MSRERTGLRSYHRITSEDITALTAIAGRENIIVAPEKLIDYGRDETPLLEPVLPEIVIKPQNTQAVSALLKYASQKRIAVTTRGGGTGLSGGCVPTQGGIVLSMEKMNRLLEIDRNNFVAVVEPGLQLGKLRDSLEEVGLSYPVTLGEMTATVGGSIATNAGGMNAVKYGVTRHHVLGLEAVLAGGEILSTGGRFVKCSSGYDLTQLLVGSEGTLAVITRVTLKLQTRPACREALFIPFHNLQQAIDSVPEILMLGKVPVGLEFMEESILHIAELYTGKKLPYRGYAAFLLVLAEADSQDEIAGYFCEVEAVVRKHGAAEAMVPPGRLAMKKLLEAREGFYHAIKKFAPMQILDTVVPRSEIARFVADVKKLETKYDIPVIVYGHAGDGNVHLHPVHRDMPYAVWKKRLASLMKDIYALCDHYGGSVSGEHGIGIDKKEFFNSTVDKMVLKTLKKIKAALDPHHVLNPGKIFD